MLICLPDSSTSLYIPNALPYSNCGEPSEEREAQAPSRRQRCHRAEAARKGRPRESPDCAVTVFLQS